MLDFEVQRCTRRCHATDRELAPGESFYSVLIRDGAQVVRRDFCESAWTGPGDEAIGWWKAEIPSLQSKKMHWAPNDVILHYFQQLQDQPQAADTRYILALLMIRRRIVRLEDSDTDPQAGEQLVVYCPRNEQEYRVPVADPSPQRIAEIQAELGQLLFSSGA